MPSVPRRFRGILPDVFLEQRTTELRLKAEELERMRDVLRARLGRPRPRPAKGASRVVLVRGRKAVVAKFRDLLANATSEIVSYTSEHCVSRQALFAIPIYETKARDGVDIRLAVNITKDNLAAVKSLAPYVRLRHHDLGNRILTVLVIDGRKGLLIHWNPDDHDLFHGDDTGIASEDAGFSGALRTAVLDRWDRSAEAADRLRDLAAAAG